MPPELQSIINWAVGPALGSAVVGTIGWMFYNGLKKRVTDVEKIPNLEIRVTALEQQALQHNETRDAVIRLESKVENLTEKVSYLTDLLTRKVFNTNG